MVDGHNPATLQDIGKYMNYVQTHSKVIHFFSTPRTGFWSPTTTNCFTQNWLGPCSRPQWETLCETGWVSWAQNGRFARALGPPDGGGAM